MKLEQYKILAIIRVRDGLTAREIAEETGVNLNTVNTWLKRHADSLVERAGVRQTRGGKAPIVWALRAAAREEADRLLDAGRAQHLKTLIDPEETRAAYRDSYRRAMVAHCVDYAAEAEDPEIRARFIEEARSWLAREEKRIAHFSKSTEPVPKEVKDELADLQERIAALGLGIDRLRNEDALRVLESARQWIAETVDRWVKAAPGDETAFLPLTPVQVADIEDKAALLRAVLRMSWRVARVSQDLMLVAALAALSHPLHPESRKIICQVLRNDIPDAQLGSALDDQLNPRTRPRRSLTTEFIAVFVALDRSERFLDQPNVKAWFERVDSSPCWQDRFAPFYIKTALNQRDNQAERLIESLSNSLRRAHAEYVGRNDDFLAFVAALPTIRIADFYGRIEPMLSRLEPQQAAAGHPIFDTMRHMLGRRQAEGVPSDFFDQAGWSAFVNHLTAEAA